MCAKVRLKLLFHFSFRFSFSVHVRVRPELPVRLRRLPRRRVGRPLQLPTSQARFVQEIVQSSSLMMTE
jgi:hypothetical protein